MTTSTPTPTGTDYRDICISCAEMDGAREPNLLWDLLGEDIGLSYLLHESASFVVIPGAGAIVPGYTLIIPRQHILSMGFLPPALDEEFLHILGGVTAWLQAEFGQETHVFEHGAKNFREKGGACADHAHTQVAPLGATDTFIASLHQDFSTRTSDSYLDSARETVALGQGDPYLYTHSASHHGAIAVATGARGQYFRRIMARHAGRPDEWDGPVCPHIDHMRLTLDAGRALPGYL
jgi:diadenosine tetraphosphate (Ap4A) HIT family hydrolase